MVTRYAVVDASVTDSGEYVAYSDYLFLSQRVSELEGVLRTITATVTQYVPPPAKTPDEQAVADFVLNLVRKVK